ncbi:MAG: CPBP family intramembrane metalloprotease [Myxococcaceae bacterium]|nr:CPBP family intramembrane metalloprotease [Myxococcaceae bacterium]
MNVKRSLALVAVQILVVFVLTQMVLAPRLVPDPEDLYAPSAVLFGLLAFCAVMGGAGLVWWASVERPGRTWRELGWHGDRLGRQLGLGVLGALACLGIAAGLLTAVGVSLSELVEQVTSFSWPQRLVFVCIGLQAAFIEESLFRGNLMPALRRHMGPAAALVLTAVLFALYHLNPSPLALLGKTGFGLVYGALALTQRSLVASAVAHGLCWAAVGSL